MQGGVTGTMSKQRRERNRQAGRAGSAGGEGQFPALPGASALPAPAPPHLKGVCPRSKHPTECLLPRGLSSTSLHFGAQT